MCKNCLKILFIFLFLFCNIASAKDGLYLYRNSLYVYDINTFCYNSNNNTFNIDIFYDIHGLSDKNKKTITYLKDNNFVQYVIINVLYSPKDKTFDFKYKGFITGIWALRGSTYSFNDAKFYYENFAGIEKYYKNSIKKFKKYALLAKYNYYMDFDKDINEIYRSILKNINELEYQTSINN